MTSNPYAEVLATLREKWQREDDARELRLARPDLEVSSEPPLVQDDTALARIQPDPVPYPLMRAPRADVGVGALAWYLCRLVWWRIRSRGCDADRGAPMSGCLSGSCRYDPPKGQHVNGPCRCDQCPTCGANIRPTHGEHLEWCEATDWKPRCQTGPVAEHHDVPDDWTGPTFVCPRCRWEYPDRNPPPATAPMRRNFVGPGVAVRTLPRSPDGVEAVVMDETRLDMKTAELTAARERELAQARRRDRLRVVAEVSTEGEALAVLGRLVDRFPNLRGLVW